jgi:hypothetical protein
MFRWHIRKIECSVRKLCLVQYIRAWYACEAKEGNQMGGADSQYVPPGNTKIEGKKDEDTASYYKTLPEQRATRSKCNFL